MMRWIRRLFVITCLVATCLLVWAGVYARKQGFTKSWRDAIEREFAERGWHVEIGKITLGAFRGLVAEDVTFFETEKRRIALGTLDDVYLDVDLSRILSKEVSVNTLDVEKARLSLPLDPTNPAGARLQVVNLSGRVIVTESMIEVVSASAEVEGFQILLKGSLLRSENNESDTDVEVEDEEALWTERRNRFLGVIETLREIEFLGAPPVVSMEFRGDLQQLSTTDATVRIEAGRFRKKGHTYEIAELEGVFRYDGQSREADVERLILKDARGDASFAGMWKVQENRVDFSGESTLDLTSLAGYFWADPRLQEVVFFDPPSVKLDGHWIPGAGGAGFPGNLIGEFQSDRFVTRGRVFSGIDLGFSLEEEKFYIRNLRLDHKSGVAFLNLKHEPGLGTESIQYQTEIKLDPHVFRPFFDDQGRKFLDSWRFSEESTVYLAAAGRGKDWDLKTWENRGVIDLRNFKLNGVEFLEMESQFESQEGTQWFRDISLVREEGKILAEVARHDIGDKLWDVKGVVSTVDIQQGARAFSPQLATRLAPYRFDKPPTIFLEGVLDARRQQEVGEDPRRTDLLMSFESSGKARYDFLGKTLELTNCRGKIKVEKSRVHLTGFRANTFGGSLSLDYDARNVRSSSRPFVARLEVENIPLEAITKTYRNSETIRGQIGGTLALSGNASDPATFQGNSVARISNGNLFAIPVLGPLSKAISKANSGSADLGPNIVREATATIRIENGVLKSQDLVALADSFEVRSAGSVSLVSQEVDLEAVVNTRGGLSRAILTPVSELLTFSCTGTIEEPVWKSKHISNLGKLPAQMITEITNVPVQGLKAIGKGLFGEREGSAAGPREVGPGDTNREIGGVDPRTAPPEKPRPRLLDRFRQGGQEGE